MRKLWKKQSKKRQHHRVRRYFPWYEPDTFPTLEFEEDEHEGECTALGFVSENNAQTV